jgi:hypothetical protein
MLNGITWHGLHSQVDFGATLTERDTNVPSRDRITDRVPYSSVTHDFSALFGKPSYPERTLQYKFTISDEHGIHYLRPRVERFKHWLYDPTEKSELYDDREKEYHFNAVCTGFHENYTNGVKAEITVVFQADPYMLPSVSAERQAIPVSDCRYPDIDADGRVTAADAAMILTAAANIGTGQESGLTPEQEFLADADRDGIISAADATLVQTFVSQCGAGIWSNDEEGWTDFINYNLDRMPEVL